MDASPNNRRISRALYASGTAHMIVGTLAGWQNLLTIVN